MKLSDNDYHYLVGLLDGGDDLPDGAYIQSRIDLIEGDSRFKRRDAWSIFYAFCERENAENAK